MPDDRTLPTAGTIESLVIDDAGHVLATPQTWSGDVYVIPAARGTRF